MGGGRGDKEEEEVLDSSGGAVDRVWRLVAI